MTGFARVHARKIAAFGLLAGFLVSTAAGVGAQAADASRQAGDEQSRGRVRDEFMKVLQKYPPSVGQVLKLDPTLLTSEPYLAPYPAIAAYLTQHPEIRRSPSWYFSQVSGGDGYYYDPRDRAWDRTFEGLAVVVAIAGAFGGCIWLIRTAIDYRRWGRLAKVQAEAHTKLLDRFTGNEELLAYVQSPAGSRFLKSSPIAIDGNPRAVAAPISRILWSIQAGVVLTAAGVGLNYASRRIDADHADPVFMFATLLLAVGIGFVASAGLSYMLSHRLGLLGRGGPDADD